MTNKQNRFLTFCVPKPKQDLHSEALTVRYITTKEYFELYDHVLQRKPVYLFNSAFEIKDYYATSMVTKYKNDFTDITVCLSIFRQNIHEEDLSTYYYYIKDYTISNTDVVDITIPLCYLSIKPFNSRAGNLLYGKT